VTGGDHPPRRCRKRDAAVDEDRLPPKSVLPVPGLPDRSTGAPPPTATASASEAVAFSTPELY